MSDIRILPDQLANRIAAGEVVERPASVVKELIENSIDAQATRIDIDIERGGTGLIRVKDNGIGMDEDDALMCFERHGTSKIEKDDDLAAIHTLGFRGEALPSIASVSRIQMTSRKKESDFGTLVDMSYGKLLKVHETGCSHGTLIEVQNLFGRIPARRKFLKSKRTELSHIEETVRNYALACPHIGFTLTVDGRTTLLFTESQSLQERLRAIFSYQGEFIVVGEESLRTPRNLHGLLIPPDLILPTGGRMRLFINGRAIRDRLVHHAVMEGLHGFLLKGRTPSGYLHLRIPADEVDVNVHPAKHEVRFRNTTDIHQYIKQNVENAMRGYQQIIRREFMSEKEPQNSYEETVQPHSVAEPEPYESFAQPSSLQNHEEQSPASCDPYATGSPPQETISPVGPAHIPRPLSVARTVPAESPTGNGSNPAAPFPVPERVTTTGHDMRILGQYHNLYIFCQNDENLLVIDQHAAHERLLFEKLRSNYRDGSVAKQNLLFPETVELSPSQLSLIEENLEEFEKLGFSITEFGGNSYVISAVPALLSEKYGPSELFFDTLAGFGDSGTSREPGGKMDDLISRLACRAAIKSGRNLKTEEIDALLNEMVRTDLFSHCPHGRPVVKKFTPDDIKKWFSRT